ncbi:MAG TPA: hypothetical protein HA224_00015 [Nanoarchaeota archaeon]|nr:hypothetical protein [Nanoarchaeota archaeon]
MVKSKYILFALIVLLSVFSIAVRPGYAVFSGDQEIYMPAIYRTLGIAEYSGDILQGFDQSKYTFFDEIVSLLIKTLNINVLYVFVILTLIFRFLFFYAVYALARYFTNNKAFSILAMFLFSQDFWIYGSSTALLETSLIPRTIALPLALLALACFLNKRIFIAGLLVASSALMHPITAMPFILFFYLRPAISFVRKTRNKALWLLALFALPIAAALILLYFFLPTRIDAVWDSIVHARVPYLLITAWPAFAFAYLALNTLFLKISLGKAFKNLNENSKKLNIVLLLAVPILLFILSFVFVDIFKFQFIAQLQLHRGMVLYKMLSVLFFSYYAYLEINYTRNNAPHKFVFLALIAGLFVKEYVVFILLPLLLLVWLEKRSLLSPDAFNKVLVAYLLVAGAASFWLNADLFKYYVIAISLAILMALIISLKQKPAAINAVLLIFILASTIVFMPKFSAAPEYHSDKELMDACSWIKNNTPKNSIIMSEPFSKVSTPIRLDCHRAVFSSKKDGAQAIFSRPYAVEWAKRNDLLANLAGRPDAITELSSEYAIDYVISNYKINWTLPIAYENSKYFIYNATSK